MAILGREPVLWLAVVRQGILLAVMLGLNLTPVVIAGIMFFVETVLALITRGQVFAQPETVAQVKSYIEAAPPAVGDKAVAQVAASNAPSVQPGQPGGLRGPGGPIALLLGLLLVTPAVAAPGPGPIVGPRVDSKPSRFAAGLILGGALYSHTDGSPGSSAFNPGVGLTYSGTQNFSLSLVAEGNTPFEHPWGDFGLSLNSAVVGTKPGENLHISIGGGFYHYWGELPPWITTRDTFRGNARTAWVVFRGQETIDIATGRSVPGRPRLYGQLSADVDLNNKQFKRVKLSAIVPILGGAAQ